MAGSAVRVPLRLAEPQRPGRLGRRRPTFRRTEIDARAGIAPVMVPATTNTITPRGTEAMLVRNGQMATAMMAAATLVRIVAVGRIDLA